MSEDRMADLKNAVEVLESLTDEEIRSKVKETVTKEKFKEVEFEIKLYELMIETIKMIPASDLISEDLAKRGIAAANRSIAIIKDVINNG